MGGEGGGEGGVGGEGGGEGEGFPYMGFIHVGICSPKRYHFVFLGVLVILMG